MNEHTTFTVFAGHSRHINSFRRTLLRSCDHSIRSTTPTRTTVLSVPYCYNYDSFSSSLRFFSCYKAKAFVIFHVFGKRKIRERVDVYKHFVPKHSLVTKI